MSMVHNLRQPICNKDKAVLHLLLSTSSDPIGQVVGTIQDYPWSGGGYKKCELFEVPHMIRIWVQSILGTGQIILKPEDFKNDIYAIFGVDTGRIQETETQIVGFNKTPTPVSFARFLYGPPNQFTKKIKPDVLMD